MSLLVRTVGPDLVRLLYVYDAPESWSVQPGVPEEDPYCPQVSGNDRTGCWFASSWERDRWIAALLRHDTPFNDCLPPTGTCLTEAWEQTRGSEDLLEDVHERAEESFLNPFDAYAGDWSSSTVHHLKQSFQSKINQEDTDCLAVSNRPEHDSYAFLDDGMLPGVEELIELARIRTTDGGLFHEDARLPTRGSVIIESRGDSRTVSVLTGYPEPEARTETMPRSRVAS